MALYLLEALRDQDLPAEVLDDENLTLTLPRRLGLSGVVDAQIRRYRDDARRRRRISDGEIQDLIRLVVRRPDAEEVFLRVGGQLHGEPRRPDWRRILPGKLARSLARRRIRKQLQSLFGRPVVRSAGPDVSLEAVDDLLIRGDPGGDACAMITGLARVELSRVGESPELLEHVACRGRGSDRCEWDLVDDASQEGGEGVAPSD